jgi:hypothetical protein
VTVYVDNLQMKVKLFGWWGTWSNLYADTTEELIDFAEVVTNLSPACMFDQGYINERYVINEKKRVMALEKGAVAIHHGGPAMLRILRTKKQQGYKEKGL